MFKSMLKRSWLSTIRKPSRTIILVVILFVMANMLLATLAIKNSVSVSMNAAKEKLGGIVYLTTDTEKLQEQMQSQRGASGPTQFTMPTISEELAKGIGESEFLTSSTYSISITANSSNYKTVETVQNQREREMQEQFQNMRDQVENMEEEYNSARDRYNAAGAGPGDRMMRGNGDFSFSMNIDIADPTLSGGDTSIQGIDNFNFVSEVESGTLGLVNGAIYTAESENAAIVSQTLLDDNELNIGDTIKLKTISDETEITLTIVGSYKSTEIDENGEDSFNNNTIYTNITTAKNFMTDEQIENLTVNNVKYYLASAESKDAFLSWAGEKYPSIVDDGLKLDIDDSSYQTMVGPIENVGSFAGVTMWIVAIATVVIITLIVVINVKDRRYEMGVLLSLGAKRATIVGQIFIELFIVGTVGFMLSLCTGQLIAGRMGESLLAQQISDAETAEEETQTVNSGPGRSISISRFGMNVGSNSDAKAIDEINVSAGLTEYLILFGAGYLILIIAMIAPSINILRYQPKTILTGKE